MSCTCAGEYPTGLPPGRPPQNRPYIQDFAQLAQYHSANEALKALPVVTGRVVFLGDSITREWDLAESFPGEPYVNRGISGQTTEQMLLRIFQDVLDLKPSAMILHAGTNDIHRNTGPETLQMVEDNVQAMTELTQAHGIKVILCSITPTRDTGAEKLSETRPLADILRVNNWLKEYAVKSGAIYCDYFSALADKKGTFKEEFSDDGLHPNVKGHEVMASLAQSAIDQALK